MFFAAAFKNVNLLCEYCDNCYGEIGYDLISSGTTRSSLGYCQKCYDGTGSNFFYMITGDSESFCGCNLNCKNCSLMYYVITNSDFWKQKSWRKGYCESCRDRKQRQLREEREIVERRRRDEEEYRRKLEIGELRRIMEEELRRRREEMARRRRKTKRRTNTARKRRR